MVNSEEIIRKTEYLLVLMRCHINWCHYNWVWLYLWHILCVCWKCFP